ncbi:MAG TPA: hypothetical protein VF595_17585 [Tepidisphaeraceae bacterium]|jgi:hypothetical protein
MLSKWTSPDPYPAAFKEWLSGDFISMEPPAWQYAISQTGVVIAPAWNALITVALFLLITTSVSAVFLYSTFHVADDAMAWVKIIFFVVLGLGFGHAAVLLGWIFAQLVADRAKGRILVYSRVDECVSLPRHHRVFAKKDVSRFRTVSGNWIGPERKQKHQRDAISELHLIVNSPSGEMAYLIASTMTISIGVEAEAIALATGLPLERVVQQQGVHTPQEWVGPYHWQRWRR